MSARDAHDGESSYQNAGERVRVVLRCRPLSSGETAYGRKAVVRVDEANRQVVLSAARAGDSDARDFTFDAVFGPSATQLQVFEQTARSIVDGVLEGYNGTIFAYGQTGAGKTFTMEGGAATEGQGITPRTFTAIFDAIAASADRQFLVRASFLEVYNEEIRDLLCKSPQGGATLALREGGQAGRSVRGLSAFIVRSPAEMHRILEVGKKNRVTAATAMNQESSRSHSVFTITVESSIGGGIDDATGIAQAAVRVGKLNLVDLAGSERVGKSRATGDRLREATRINLSLSALGNVVSALAEGGTGHIPYRDSKLTRLLQDSLGGNARTVMIANVGPADFNYDETLGTLRFAGRAARVCNRPVVNEDPKDAMLRQYQQEIARLRAELARPEHQPPLPPSPLPQPSLPEPAARPSGAAAAQTEAATEPGASRIYADMAAGPAEPAPASPAASVGLQAAVAATSPAVGALQAEMEAQIEASQRAQAEMQRLQAESAAKREEVASLEASMGAQAAAMAEVARQRDEEAARRQDLTARLEKLQSKLLVGATTIQTARQIHRDSSSSRRSAQAIRAAMRARSEADHAAAAAEVSDLQTQASQATAELQRMWRRHEAARAELREMREAWAAERHDLELQAAEMLRQLDLKDLVISTLVSQTDLDRVMRQAAWSPETGHWSLAEAPDFSALDFGLDAEARLRNGGMRSSVATPPKSIAPPTVLLAKPPWELQSASSVASWQGIGAQRQEEFSDGMSSNGSSSSRERLPWYQLPSAPSSFGDGSTFSGDVPPRSRLSRGMAEPRCSNFAT